ncbi:MAG: PAC2 family protein [Candidatus Bathyarchaeia archaeon]
MVCVIEFSEKPQLNNPVLIEGLPGIGFVANIATLHLIRELNAKRFATIVSASFQDFAVTSGSGGAYTPINELYYVKRSDGGRDLILWYGNTQALTTFGQYELCGKVLDVMEELGCRYVVSVGGFKKDDVPAVPGLYSAATDQETLKLALDLGTKVMVGHIFGVAGILIGLCRLRGICGFSLLVDTLGLYPDVNAARYALTVLGKFLGLSVDLSRLEASGESVKQMLEAFGLFKDLKEEKKREAQQLRWFI